MNVGLSCDKNYGIKKLEQKNGVGRGVCSQVNVELFSSPGKITVWVPVVGMGAWVPRWSRLIIKPTMVFL